MSETETAPMPEPNATPAPDPAPTRPMRLTQETIAIIGLAALIVAAGIHFENRLDTAITEAAADRRAADARMREFRAEATADRRAANAKMDEFRTLMDQHRRDMQRLGERQARLEGQREGAGA